MAARRLSGDASVQSVRASLRALKSSYPYSCDGLDKSLEDAESGLKLRVFESADILNNCRIVLFGTPDKSGQRRAGFSGGKSVEFFLNPVVD